MSQIEVCDVVIIGAGPAGAIASSILAQNNLKTVVIERETFPRFSIGESLLPQSMEYIEQAGMLDALNDNAKQLSFQFKNGAAFYRKGQRSEFNFEHVDQLPEPDAVRSQQQFLQRWGIDELVDEGKRLWEANAARPDLAAMKMRSRVSEAEALLDPAGLGNFIVAEWRS